jgi:phage-related minor tail protein
MKEVYDRAISQMLAGRNKAFIAEVGTSQQKLAQEYSDVASQMESVWTSCFENLTDKLTEFVKTGKFSIADFGDYIFDEMLKVSTKALVVEPLMQSLGMGTNSEPVGAISCRVPKMRLWGASQNAAIRPAS